MAYGELARELHRRAGLQTEVCAIVLRELVDLVADRIRMGESVWVPGLGRLRPTYRRPHVKVSNLPAQRGKKYEIPLRITAFLQPCTAFLREERYSVPSETLTQWEKEKQQGKKARSAPPRQNPWMKELLSREPEV